MVINIKMLDFVIVVGHIHYCCLKMHRNIGGCTEKTINRHETPTEW